MSKNGSSGSLGSNKSSSGSSGGFNQDVWGPQGEALQGLYSSVGNLFSGLNSSMMPRVETAAGMNNDFTNQAAPAWQNQMQGGAYSDLNIGENLTTSLNNSLNTPSATSEINAMIMGGSGNNYADAMKDQYISDANTATDNMLANLDARAAASGMSGGSRHGIATAKGMDDINSNLQKNLATTGYQTFDKDLDRKLSIAGAADANTMGRQQMMSNMLGQQQNTMNSGLAFGSQMQNMNMGQFAPYMAPWQMAGNYANTIGAPTVLSSGSMGSSSDSKGGGLSGSK